MSKNRFARHTRIVRIIVLQLLFWKQKADKKNRRYEGHGAVCGEGPCAVKDIPDFFYNALVRSGHKFLQ